jgi:hypothetical protein
MPGEERFGSLLDGASVRPSGQVVVPNWSLSYLRKESDWLIDYL